MTNAVTPPAKGQPVRASWAVALTDAVNRNTAELSSRPALASPNQRQGIGAPFPFQVIGGTDDGSAKLSIYVPQGSIVVADEEIDAGDIDGISAVDDAPGYCTVDDLDDLAGEASAAQPLYLVIWRDDTESNPTTNATVTLDPESVDGTVILQATIALVWASTVTTSEGDSKTYGAVAEQIIRSAVHIGRGSGSGGGGGSGGSTSGFTGSKDVIYAFDGPRSDGKLYAKTKTWTYQNGLLQSISTQDGAEIVVAETVDHQGL